MRFLPFVLLATFTSASSNTGTGNHVEKRCRLGRAIMPCWVEWDHLNCEPYLTVDVSVVIDKPNKQITISGICKSCSEALVKERELEKAEEYSRYDTWGSYFGRVDDRGNGTFVISDASDDAMAFHKGLAPYPGDWATSCVDVASEYFWMTTGR